MFRENYMAAPQGPNTFFTINGIAQPVSPSPCCIDHHLGSQLDGLRCLWIINSNTTDLAFFNY
jgi:hypothetical protein